MKVVITTFTQYDNYGSRLQNYALCCAVQMLGNQPVTLTVINVKDDIYKVVKSILSMFPLINQRQKKWINERKKKKKFQHFNRELRLDRVKLRDLQTCPIEGIAIAGSDQIWLPTHILRCPSDTDLYFLRFVPPKMRYAYAPSFGVEKIPNELTELYTNYLNDFQELSVRELSGAKIIKDLTGREAPVLPDPTFLLAKEEWQALVRRYGVKLPSERYLITYFLSDQSAELWSTINQYAICKKLRIIRIAGNQYIKGEIVPSPEEFVGLINMAEAVFTDSFHGSVFSIIMNRPFAVFKRTDVEQFSRIENLLGKYGLDEAFCENGLAPNAYDSIFKKQDFLWANNVMTQERKKGFDYLKKIMQCSQNKQVI